MGPLEAYDVIASTQARARELARTGAPDFTVVTARRQTTGLGRLDHRWASPEGGFYGSVVAPSASAPAPLVPLAVGAELVERLARWHVVARLKWPNDLFVTGPGGPPRKLGGILVDRVASGSGPRLVVGLGLNVRPARADFPPELRDRIAILDELTPDRPSFEEVRDDCVRAVRAAVAAVAAPAGRDAVLARCRAALFGVGRPALVDGKPRGIIRGLGDAGELTLADGPAEVRVFAGDLTVLEAA